MLENTLAYRVEFVGKTLPLLLGASMNPIHVDVDVEVTNARIRFVLECVLVTDHGISIMPTDKFVQRGDNLALADVPLACQINVTKLASFPPDLVFEWPGKAGLHVMESRPKDHKLLVPKALMENRI